MEIFFRVDASISIGTGHVVRCLNLAEKLRLNNFKCSFITKSHPGNLIAVIEEKGYEVFVVNSTDNKNTYSDNEYEWLGDTQRDDALKTIDILDKANVKPEIIIVDHYAIDYKWEEVIRENYPFTNLIVIDDLANRKHLCDLLIDTTLERNISDYNHLIPSNCQTLLGTRYSLINENFYQLRNEALKCRIKTSSPKKILITMGGIDIFNIAAKTLEIINRSFARELDLITVVLGKNCPHIEGVKNFASTMLCETNVLIDTNKMPELMLSHHASIGALGGTTWERCVLGLPSINLAIANNQKILINKLKSKGLITICDLEFTDEEFNESWEKLKYNYKDISLRSSQLCDGLGLTRVAGKIKSISTSKRV